MTSGHGWLGIVTPILVAAPGYFGGGLSFGGLMMVIGAFNQVQQSLRWFVEHFHQIADWRATLLRVMALRDALAAPDSRATNRAASRWSTMLRDISGSRTSASRSVVVAPRSTTPASRSPRASAS